MGRWILLSLVAMATLVTAQNDTSDPTTTPTGSMFGELPVGNYTSDTDQQANVGSLQGLFDMAQGFVNVVFRPFGELTELVEDIFESGDALGYLGDNWQEVAKFDVGFIVCLVFGVLFIVFVPLVGSIMCCCRCCGNCGGRLEQSTKRSKSCWRQCLCVSMLVLTTLMTVPTVFVFLTNEWITDVIDTGPIQINSVLGDSSEYLQLVPKQVHYITDQYNTVDKNVRPLVEDFGITIGVPLQKEVESYSEDALRELESTTEIVDDILQAITDVDTSLTALKNGVTVVDTSLSNLRINMSTNLSPGTCTGDADCNAVYVTRNTLTLGFNVADLADLRTELGGVNDTLTGYDLVALQNNITKEINDIPQTTKDQTADASTEALNALDEANKTMADVSSAIPTDSFDDLDQQISQLQNTIEDAFKTYDDNFDKYRYIAGVVLGSILAVVVGFYLLGMLLGVCGHDRKVSPSERGCASNCGGILLMVGVGLSFIFSWLLMILVVVTFTIGGHSERYGCQSLEGPNYEAFSIIEDQTNINIAGELGLPNGSLSLKEVMDSCEKNAGAYTAFKLHYLVNITEELDAVNSQTEDLQTEIDKAVADIDLSTISVYSSEDQADLLELKESGLDGIDFDDYTAKLGTGIVATNLTEYAEFLRTQAAGIDNSTHRAQVLAYAIEVDRIQNEEVSVIQDDYDTLKESIDKLKQQPAILNSSLEMLDETLVAFNQSINENAPVFIKDLADDISQQIVGNISAYTDWVADQVETELGACRPVYTAYTDTLGIFCDYLIDTINGLWFSLGWCIFFLIPSAIVAMKLMKFFRKMSFNEQYEEDFEDNIPPLVYLPGLKNYQAENTRSWNDMEMNDYARSGNGKGGYY